MKRVAPLALLGIGFVFSAGLAANAIANGPSARSNEVSGPAIGPSGQTGELRWLENPAEQYRGGATEVGPYRLLPPGTLYISRDYPDDIGSRDFGQVTSPSELQRSSLYVAPVDGYEVKVEQGVTKGGEIISIDSIWTGPAGETLVVSSAAVPEWMLPLDVYLYPDDSRLEIVVTTIAGRHALVERPKSGPAPNVGYVRLWLDDHELVLRSPSLGQDRLVTLAESILKGR